MRTIHTVMFTHKGSSCLENRPDKRPSSAVLVKKSETYTASSLPTGSNVAAPTEQIRQQLYNCQEGRMLPEHYESDYKREARTRHHKATLNEKIELSVMR